MFDKVLIANRGEIALRILRACREMGIDTVAVHSTADADAMHVRLADESVCIGPPSARESYLNAASIIAAADITGAQAIHPGYGFLSENADFAQMVIDHDLCFIGPRPEHIRVMGDKVEAKKTAQGLGLPVVPGTDHPIADEDDLKAAVEATGYPALIKAAAGGGGRGMTVVHEPSELLSAYQMAKREAAASFGDDRVYVEKFLDRPRHIEVQVLADQLGNVVHLGERDCSIQRRHQKVVEEAPSPALDAKTRAAIGEKVREAMAAFGYLGVGTIEFLYENGEFHFIEMNTRIQVEHPVTEMITGIDLVREQILVAHGERLRLHQNQIRFEGHAIECRVNAEDPHSHIPSPGRVTAFHAPGGPGVRMDSALYAGYFVPPHYDSLIAKLIVHSVDRANALRRMERSLGETVVEGIATNIPLLRAMLKAPDIIQGDYDTGWLARFLTTWKN